MKSLQEKVSQLEKENEQLRRIKLNQDLFTMLIWMIYLMRKTFLLMNENEQDSGK